jgi:DNA-directed RNA polymerase subunit RPC12/RpoP
MDETCARCGKKLNWTEKHARGNANPVYRVWQHHPEYKGRRFCRECQEEFFKEEARKPLCLNCGYGKVIDHIDAFGDSVYSSQSLSCRKFSMDVKGRGESEAPNCKSFIPKEEYKEKALKGELLPEKDYLTCQYCKTHYDANQYFKCPRCGSPTT